MKRQYMRIVLATLLAIISFETAQAQNRMRRPPQVPSEVEHLRKENEELRNQLFSYRYCVNGLAKDILDESSANAMALIAFAKGNYQEYQVKVVERDATRARIRAKCENAHEFNDGF